ncbi:MAG: response regulator transcription factor [Pontibacterium sp.]
MHLLLAEDDENLSRGLSVLFKHEGYDTTCITDGGQVLAAFDRVKPDVCVLDVMLPNQDGISLCSAIRERDPLVPIIMLSACGEEVDRVIGLDSGADDYLTKPFSTRELLSRINAVLRRVSQPQAAPSSAQSDHFALAGITVNGEALKATLGEESVDLSRREVAILSLFYQSQGKVLSRDEIMNHAWGHDYLPSSRALDQCMSGLRKKLMFDRDESFIETVYGAGYRYPNEGR